LVITKSSNKPGIWISQKIGYTAPGFFHIPGMVITDVLDVFHKKNPTIAQALA